MNKHKRTKICKIWNCKGKLKSWKTENEQCTIFKVSKRKSAVQYIRKKLLSQKEEVFNMSRLHLYE